MREGYQQILVNQVPGEKKSVAEGKIVFSRRDETITAAENLTKLEIAYKLLTDVELEDYSDELGQIIKFLQNQVEIRRTKLRG